MQVTRVSFMNFNGAKKVAPKDLKKAEDYIKNDVKDLHKYFPDSAPLGKVENAADDKYIKQYAENREVMRQMIREPEPNVAEGYFTPFMPINNVK